MMTREAKALFYAMSGPFMAANGLRHRKLSRTPQGSRAHLGPGQKNYIKGWINCDANTFTGKCDRWVDLRNPLPFPDNSLDAIYSHHVVEHLIDMPGHFREAMRVLRSGGVYRVAGPDADMAIKRYLAGDSGWFSDWPDKHRSMGARLNNWLMCRGEHVALLTEDLLRELLEDAGATNVRRAQPRESHFPELFSDVFPFEEEKMDAPYTIVIEAVKQ